MITFHNSDTLSHFIIPRYFRQSKLTSFQRQVNLYGFRRLTAGTDRGAYYHELFLRGRPDLYKRLVRIRVKGTGIKSASSPATEPDFYTYPRCVDGGAKVSSSVEADTVMPPLEPVKSSQFGEAQEAMPTWKPLSAPPKMMTVSPQLGPIEAPTSMGSLYENISLSSMALGIVSGSSSVSSRAPQEEPCPVTPDSLRQLVSNELDQALAMVSPGDSPAPSSLSIHAFPGRRPGLLFSRRSVGP